MRRFRSAGGPTKVAFFAFLYAATVMALPAQDAMKASPPAGAAGQAAVSGSIERIVGATIFVSGGDSAVTSVGIGADTLILGRKRATLDSIRVGEALGVAAAKAEDGSLTATAINVFSPELWQRVRKGQFPMADGQVMTNAQVDRLGAGVRGRTLYLKYEMLTAAIAVPQSAEIRRSVALKLSDLNPGEKVMVRGSAASGGGLAASTISVDLPE